MAITEQLAYLIAATTCAQSPANAVTQAKRALLDTIGAALAGHGEEAGRLITAWVEDVGGRQRPLFLGQRSIRRQVSPRWPTSFTSWPTRR